MYAFFDTLFRRHTSQLCAEPEVEHEEKTPCGECGMPVSPGEYHPYAACLMYRGSGDPNTVTTNLDSVLKTGAMEAELRRKESIGGFPRLLVGHTRGGRAVIAIKTGRNSGWFRGVILIHERPYARLMAWPLSGRLDWQKPTPQDLLLDRLRPLTGVGSERSLSQ